jgi:hypothetical protein
MYKYLLIPILHTRSEFRFWNSTPVGITRGLILLRMLRNCCETVAKTEQARLAELVYALDLGSSGATLKSSSLLPSTKFLRTVLKNTFVMVCKDSVIRFGTQLNENLKFLQKKYVAVLGSRSVSPHSCIIPRK